MFFMSSNGRSPSFVRASPTSAVAVVGRDPRIRVMLRQL
jgi:hypothetical protein